MVDDEETSPKKSSGGMTDVARRILLTGLGAIFMTEEGIRKTLGDLKVPKDAMGYVLDTMRRHKDEILSTVAGELGRFLSKVKVHEELRKALAGLQVHLDAKLTFDQSKKEGEHAAKLSVKKVAHRRQASE